MRKRSASGDSLQALVAKHKAKAVLKEKEMTFRQEVKAEEEVKGNEAEIEKEEESNIITNLTFEELGVCSEICEAIKAMGYKHPSKI